MENSKKNQERFFALLKRVDDFPKISNKENQRLRELGDLFLELEAARTNFYLVIITWAHLVTSPQLFKNCGILHARQMGPSYISV